MKNKKKVKPCHAAEGEREVFRDHGRLILSPRRAQEQLGQFRHLRLTIDFASLIWRKPSDVHKLLPVGNVPTLRLAGINNSFCFTLPLPPCSLAILRDSSPLRFQCRVSTTEPPQIFTPAPPETTTGWKTDGAGFSHCSHAEWATCPCNITNVQLWFQHGSQEVPLQTSLARSP